MDHTAGVIFMYNMGAFCNTKSIHCDMGPLCDVKRAPCNMAVVGGGGWWLGALYDMGALVEYYYRIGYSKS